MVCVKNVTMDQNYLYIKSRIVPLKDLEKFNIIQNFEKVVIEF